MKIRHRVSFQSSDYHKALLAHAGVEVPSTGFVAIDLDENDPHLVEVSDVLNRLDVVDMAYTVFRRHEIESAAWAAVTPSWHHGYPQPEDDDDYITATYDVQEYCSNCGTGLVQNAPFRMLREPRWAGKQILQLNWIFGEYLVQPELYDAVFAPSGLGCRPVLNALGGALDSVVQLIVDECVPLDVDGLECERCTACGRMKYHYVGRGFAPRPLIQPQRPAFKSAQYFGSGASAAHVVVFGQALVRELLQRKIKGVGFHPLQPG